MSVVSSNTTEATKVEAGMKKTASFEAAKAREREGKFAEAVEMYGEILQRNVEAHGQLGRQCALAYFHYGSALLLQAESQANVFGQVLQADESGPSSGTDDTSELLEISWECLETARVVSYSISEPNNDEMILRARIHLRLGDHSSETGQFVQAIEDYRKCLNIRVEIYDSHHRLLADAHYPLAEAYRYAKKEAKALLHYKKAHEILTECLKAAEEKARRGSENPPAGEKRKREDGTTTVDVPEVKQLKGVIIDLEAKVEEFEKKETKEDLSVPMKGFDDIASPPSKKKAKTDSSTTATTIGFGVSAEKKIAAALTAKSTNTLSVRRKTSPVKKNMEK